jgi:hypothetical protein
MSYLKVSDAKFDENISLREAYRILEEFISRYNARGESSTVALLTVVGLTPSGESIDPAQLYDFLECAKAIIGSRTN